MSQSSILSRYRWLIVIVTLGSLLAALVFSLLADPYYDTSISFAINRTNRQETSDYQYDGYYAIQAADLFSQTVMSWFLSPSILLEIYARAGIDPAITSIEELTSRFTVKKHSPQNIVVRFRESSSAEASQLSEAIVTDISERAAASNQNADEQSLFTVVAGRPVTVERVPNVPLNTLVATLAGLVVAVVAAYSLAYFQHSERERDA